MHDSMPAPIDVPPPVELGKLDTSWSRSDWLDIVNIGWTMDPLLLKVTTPIDVPSDTTFKRKFDTAARIFAVLSLF